MNIYLWFTLKKTHVFITYAFSMFCLGLVYSSLGPVLLEITRRTQITISTVGFIITVRSISGALGSVIAGLLVDKYDINKLSAVAMIFVSLNTLGITFVYNVWGIGVLIFVQGFGMGILSISSNMSILWLFNGKNLEPYLQAIHFMLALGEVISPFIVGTIMDNFNLNFNISFYIIASFFIPCIIFLVLLDSPTPTQTVTKSVSLKEIIQGNLTKDEKIIITLTAIFLGIYVGSESSMGTLIYTYVTKRGLGEQMGYILTSVLWIFVCIGRLIAIPISMKLTPQIILIINVLGCIISTFIMLLLDTTILYITPNQTLIIVWIGIPIYGLFASSFFPTVITTMKEMIHITGNITSLYSVGLSLGDMIIPIIITSLFTTPLGYVSLMMITFICSIIMLLVWIGFVFQKKSMKNRGVLVKNEKNEQESNPGEMEVTDEKGLKVEVNNNDEIQVSLDNEELEHKKVDNEELEQKIVELDDEPSDT
jgi:MFS family permease